MLDWATSRRGSAIGVLQFPLPAQAAVLQPGDIGRFHSSLPLNASRATTFQRSGNPSTPMGASLMIANKRPQADTIASTLGDVSWWRCHLGSAIH